MKLIRPLLVGLALTGGLYGQQKAMYQSSTPTKALLDSFAVPSGMNITVKSGGGIIVENGATLTFADGLLAIDDVSGLQTALNARQPLDGTLTAFAGITFAADTLAYGTGADAFGTTTLTSFARTLLDDANAAAARATLILNNVDNTSDINKPVSTAQAAADAVVLASAATDATTKANAAQAAAIAAAATDATTKANAAQAAAIAAAATDATTKANAAQAAAIAASQPVNANLTSIAALTTTSYGRSALELANAAAARTLFGVVIGTDVLAPNGNGSGLTALNAAQLTSGTIPDARFPATLPAASGTNLTNLNATNISSGTIASARLPTTITQATTFSDIITAANGQVRVRGYGGTAGAGVVWFGDGATDYLYHDGTSLTVRVANSDRMVVGASTTSTPGTITAGGSITTSNSTGSSINIGTGGSPGSEGSPLYTDINFRGYENDLRARIRSWDESSSSGLGRLVISTTYDGTNQVESLRLETASSGSAVATVSGRFLATGATEHMFGPGTPTAWGTGGSINVNGAGGGIAAVYYDGDPRGYLAAGATNLIVGTQGNRAIELQTNGSTRLTLAGDGTATFGNQVVMPNNVYAYWKDSIGTSRAMIGFNTSNELVINQSGNFDTFINPNGGIVYVNRLQTTSPSGTTPAIMVRGYNSTSGTVQYWQDFATPDGGLTMARFLRGNGASGYIESLNLDVYSGFQLKLNALGGSSGSFTVSGGDFVATRNASTANNTGYNDQVITGSATGAIYTFDNVAANRTWLITTRQAGASTNSAMAIVFTYGSTATVTRIIQDNTNPVLTLDFSTSGLTLQLTPGSGYGSTTWRTTATPLDGGE